MHLLLLLLIVYFSIIKPPITPSNHFHHLWVNIPLLLPIFIINIFFLQLLYHCIIILVITHLFLLLIVVLDLLILIFYEGFEELSVVLNEVWLLHVLEMKQSVNL